MHADALLLNNADDNFHKFSIFIAFSFVLHTALFAVIIFAPSIFPDRKFQPSVINVDLVSFSAPPSAPQKNIPEPVQPAKTEKPIPVKSPISVKSNVKKKTKIVSPKKSVNINKKKKKSLKKKKTIRPSQTIDQAIAKMKKKVEASQAQALSQRMSQLAREVKKDGKTRSGYGGQTGRGRASSEVMDIYKAEILYHIQKNWSILDHLVKGQTDLVVKIGIKIMPDGEIRDMWFDKRSDSTYLDEQAEKAIKKIKRLPPLPEGFTKPFLNQGLRFTPQGVK